MGYLIAFAAGGYVTGGLWCAAWLSQGLRSSARRPLSERAVLAIALAAMGWPFAVPYWLAQEADAQTVRQQHPSTEGKR